MSPLLRLSQILIHHFWFIWLFGLLGILIVSAGAFWKGWRDDGFRASGGERRVEKPSAVAVACFVAFTLLYIGFMLWREDFAFQDGHAFTDYVGIGIPRPPSIWPESGRYWPLGYDEYNLIAHLSPTATVFLVFGAIQLVVALWLLYRVVPIEKPTLRLLTFALLMLAPGFGADFAELTYADRNVVFGVCLLVFFVDRYDRRPALAWLLPAVAAGYSALYFKETTAALIGGFAIARVLLRYGREGLRSALRSPLELGLLLSCACFGVQLVITLGAGGGSKYVDGNFVGRWTAAARYLTADPLLAAFLIAFAFHVVLTLRRGGKFDPLWDALAVGGALHIVAVSITGLEEDYLMGPTELVSAITLMRLVPAWWKERPNIRPVLACVGGALVVSTIMFGSFRLIQRKNVVGQTQRLANFLVAHFKEGAGKDKPRLYFPSGGNEYDGGTVMNLLSFLNYKGLRFHRRGEPSPVDAIDVAGPQEFEGGLCVYYEAYVCQTDTMRPGDLVVRMAEDTWVNATPPKGLTLETVLLVKPVDFFPSLRPFLAALHWASPTMRGFFAWEPLQDDWLNVSVRRVVAESSAPSKN